MIRGLVEPRRILSWPQNFWPGTAWKAPAASNASLLRLPKRLRLREPRCAPKSASGLIHDGCSQMRFRIETNSTLRRPSPGFRQTRFEHSIVFETTKNFEEFEP